MDTTSAHRGVLPHGLATASSLPVNSQWPWGKDRLLHTLVPLRVVEAVTGPNDLGELGPPLVPGEVLGVRVAGPDPLEDDLVLGFVTGAAGLNHLKEKKIYIKFANKA